MGHFGMSYFPRLLDTQVGYIRDVEFPWFKMVDKWVHGLNGTLNGDLAASF